MRMLLTLSLAFALVVPAYAAQPTGQSGPLAPAARVPQVTPCDQLRAKSAQFRDYTNSLYGYGVGKGLDAVNYVSRVLPPDSPLQGLVTQFAAANIIAGGVVVGLQQEVVATNYRNTCEAPPS